MCKYTITDNISKQCYPVPIFSILEHLLMSLVPESSSWCVWMLGSFVNPTVIFWGLFVGSMRLNFRIKTTGHYFCSITNRRVIVHCIKDSYIVLMTTPTKFCDRWNWGSCSLTYLLIHPRIYLSIYLTIHSFTWLLWSTSFLFFWCSNRHAIYDAVLPYSNSNHQNRIGNNQWPSKTMGEIKRNFC